MPSKILIGDDSTTIQKEFERTFPAEEFAITFANNGEEALAKAREDKPDLVIADINMPLKNGFEVCEEVKNDPHLKGTPVLLLVEILHDFDEDESCRVGADGFIIKPLEANSALSKVREALSLKEGAPLLEEAEEKTLPMEEAVEEAVERAVDEAFEEAFPREEAAPREEAVEETIPLPEAVEGAVPREQAVKEEEEAVLELEEVVEEPAAAAPPPGEDKKQEEFILKTPLKELEAKLQQEFPGEDEEEKEEQLTLELPIDDMEPEPTIMTAEWEGVFSELRKKKEKGGKEADKEQESTGRFMEDFEQPVFEAKEEGSKTIGTLASDLEGILKEAMEGLAARLGTALGHELRRITEEVLKETVPKLLKEIERSERSDEKDGRLLSWQRYGGKEP